MASNIFFLTEGEYSLDKHNHIGYGIKCIADGQKIVFEDISVDREKVQKFITLCNKLSLSPLHLADAVQDFLNG